MKLGEFIEALQKAQEDVGPDADVIIPVLGGTLGINVVDTGQDDDGMFVWLDASE